jgi:hypothetical protein
MRGYLKDVGDGTFPRVKNATPQRKMQKSAKKEGGLKMHSNCPVQDNIQLHTYLYI